MSDTVSTTWKSEKLQFKGFKFRPFEFAYDINKVQYKVLKTLVLDNYTIYQLRLDTKVIYKLERDLFTYSEALQENTEAVLEQIAITEKKLDNTKYF